MLGQAVVIGPRPSGGIEVLHHLDQDLAAVEQVAVAATAKPHNASVLGREGLRRRP